MHTFRWFIKSPAVYEEVLSQITDEITKISFFQTACTRMVITNIKPQNILHLRTKTAVLHEIVCSFGEKSDCSHWGKKTQV